VNRQEKMYVRNSFVTAVAYVVLVFVSIELLKRMPDTPWQLLIAALPMLPLIFGLRSFLNHLSSMDELQQRIQLQAIGFAAGATGMLTLTYGLLENAGLPRLSMIWVFPLLCLLWSGASILLARRYQ
jgi:hypothetical protein